MPSLACKPDRTAILVGLSIAQTALLLSACTTAQRNPPPIHPHRTEAIQTIGQRAVDDSGIVGLSIAVSLDGEIVYASGFGHADGALTRPATARTVYDIASVGKQFSAAAVLRLMETGQLSLDDRIKDIVPETPGHFPNATIEELLHHTSGFMSGKLDELNPPAGLDQPRAGIEVLDDVELLEGSTMFAPSTTMMYCNSGYLLLGVAVEKASGLPYPEFIQQELLGPAGITGMTVCQRPAGPIMADSLHRFEDRVERVPLIHMSAYAGQGSVCSSVLDLVEWGLALDEGRIISPESLKQFRAPARVHGNHASAEIPYGMAQRMGEFHGHRKVGHTGTYDGGSAALMHYPDDGLVIAVLTNTRGSGVPHALTIEADVAKGILGIKDAPIHRRPLSEKQRRQIDGLYADNRIFEALAEADGTVVVTVDGEFAERLVHTGDLVFRREDQPHIRQWFLLDGETAGWWCYESNGAFFEALRRRD